MPKRIRLSRKKGYRKPANAVNVARPTKFGNPYKITEDRGRFAVAIAFSAWLSTSGRMEMEEKRQWILDHLHELRGEDLACWCPLDQPCHADILLKLANES